MKRAWLVYGLPLLSALLVLSRAPSGPGLFQDTDTAFLLLKLKERGDPWSWFWTDWPLANHFYRPVSTLAFELDRALHSGDPAGFGLTQALVAAACVGLATWMLYELSESHAVAALSGAVFGLWTAGVSTWEWTGMAAWSLAALSLLGLARGRGNVRLVGTAFLALAFVATDYLPVADMGHRVVGWLPGRTASVMTLFCLAAVACYARYERLGARRRVLPATAEDLPATRGTATNRPRRASAAWGAGALVCAGLAMASYEQAVMLPAVLTGAALLALARGWRPRWWVPAVSWLVLVGYLALRRAVLPAGQSGYQAQQMRYGPGVWSSLADFVFPGANGVAQLRTSLEGFPYSYLESRPWAMLAVLAGNFVFLALVWRSRHRWAWLAAWLMALVSFLPMAWVKVFGHYYFWPMAFHAWAVVVGAQVAWAAWVQAVSPPEVQAPPR